MKSEFPEKVRTGHLYIVFTIVLCLLPVVAMPQNLLWSANYGGVYSETGYAGLQAADSGYLILGSTYSYGRGGYDIYLVRTNSIGDTLWTRSYGGSSTDFGYDITATSDGGYVIVGSTKSYGSGNKDIYILKTDDTGDTLWTKVCGGSELDEANAVRQTFDNGLIICGTTGSSGAGYSDLYFIRTDSLGNSVWARTYGGVAGESGCDVRQTSDSGYIAVGSTGSFGEGYSSIYVVRIDKNGDSLWAAVYGGSGADMGYSVECTPDGGFLIVGATASYGAGYTDVYLIKTNSTGDTLWTRTYGGWGDDRGYSACLAADGTYIIIGATESFGAGNLDIYLIKTTMTGETIWTKTFGGSSSDYGRMVFQDRDGGYILIGDGYSYTYGGADMYLFKIQGEMTSVDDNDNAILPEGFELGQNYPNPFNMTTAIEYILPRHSTVTLAIYNILGQVVHEWPAQSRPMGSHIVQWDGRNDAGIDVASGVYFYRLAADDFIETKKMVLLK